MTVIGFTITYMYVCMDVYMYVCMYVCMYVASLGLEDIQLLLGQCNLAL